MKHPLVVLSGIIITILVYPFFCFSAYTIHLKNGQVFETDHYWEEEGQIKFNRYGGVVGIEKNQVQEIRESDLVDDQKAVEEKTTRPAEAGKKERPPKVDKAKGRPFDEYYKKKKELKARLDEALKRLRKATRNKDKAAKEKAREEMRRFSGEIYRLTDELKEKNNGRLPDDWWRDN